MPLLDVSEVLTDPMFTETVVVSRNVQSIDTHGRAQTTPTPTDIIAVVTAGAPDALQRAADFEAGKNTITVHTQFRLIGPSSGLVNYQPDTILYNGESYVVRKIWDWSNYGAGFIAAECEMINVTAVSP